MRNIVTQAFFGLSDSESRLMINRGGEHPLKAEEGFVGLRCRAVKTAIIVVELVDESAFESNEKIKRELLDWFCEDAISIPWVKTVRGVTVREE
ncbi:MAG: hypothetical protein QXJ02_06895 [Candidatus Bathyarchaeia archaeon]